MVEIDRVSSRILEALSEDCRTSNLALARKIGCSPQTVAKRVAWLEKEFGIKYVLEFNWDRLGLSAAYVLYAKFDVAPGMEELEKLLAEHPGPQFAALTKGDFDLVVYYVGEKDLDFSKWANWFRERLGKRIQEWQPGHVTGFWFGFFPLSKELISRMPIGEPRNKMLRLLSEDARMPLKELADRCAMPVSSVHYHLARIMDSGLVRRRTLIMQKTVKPLISFEFWSYQISPEFMKSNLKARRELMAYQESLPAISLIASFNAIGPFDDVLIRSFDDISEYPEHIEKMDAKFEGTRIRHKSALVTKTVVGDLAVRNLSPKRHYNEKLEVYDLMEWKDA